MRRRRNLQYGILLAAGLGLLGLFSPAKAAAVENRNVPYQCERYAQFVGNVTRPEGTYTTISYGLVGNDASRYTTNGADLGSQIGAGGVAPNRVDCSKPLYSTSIDGKVQLPWCGNNLADFWWDCDGKVNFRSDFYQGVLNGIATKVYVGSIFQRPAIFPPSVESGYENVPALVDSDNPGNPSYDPTRANVAGISATPNYPFGAINDAAEAFVNDKNVYCVGLSDGRFNQFTPGGCRANVLTEGQNGPGAWAGYLNGGSVNSWPNLRGQFLSTTFINSNVPAKDLHDIGVIGPNDTSFSLRLFAVNTQDPFFSCSLSYGLWTVGNPPWSGNPPCYQTLASNTKGAIVLTFFAPNTNRVDVNLAVDVPTLSPSDELSNSASFRATLTPNPSNRSIRTTATRSFYIIRNGSRIPIRGDIAVTQTFPPGTTAWTDTVNGLSTQVGDQVCEDLTVDPSAAYVDSGGNVIATPPDGGPKTQSACKRVLARPYLKVFGNDVAAGSYFADSGNRCTGGPSYPNAGIFTFNKTSVFPGNITGYSGGSTDLAGIALGVIDGFNTAGSRNGLAAPNPPFGLAVGNQSAAGTINSGGFSGLTRCVPNYYAASTNSGADKRGSGPGSVTFIAGQTIGTGTQQAIFVDGDAVITGNITYNQNGWTDTTKIPSFYLVVRGNIYIDASVTQLDGVYVAQPTVNSDLSLSNGLIYTCTSQHSFFAATSIYSACGQQLTVTGSFIANQVKFLRTNGTKENSGGNLNEGVNPNIAELFRFSQETYLAPVPAVLNSVISGGSVENYDSITSLPPVL